MYSMHNKLIVAQFCGEKSAASAGIRTCNLLTRIFFPEHSLPSLQRLASLIKKTICPLLYSGDLAEVSKTVTEVSGKTTKSLFIQLNGFATASLSYQDHYSVRWILTSRILSFFAAHAWLGDHKGWGNQENSEQIFYLHFDEKNDLVVWTKQFLFQTSFRHNIVFFLTDDDPIWSLFD